MPLDSSLRFRPNFKQVLSYIRELHFKFVKILGLGSSSIFFNQTLALVGASSPTNKLPARQGLPFFLFSLLLHCSLPQLARSLSRYKSWGIKKSWTALATCIPDVGGTTAPSSTYSAANAACKYNTTCTESKLNDQNTRLNFFELAHSTFG